MNTLIINRSDSKCMACGKSANPYELAHESVLGYFPGPGCYTIYTHVASHYSGGGIEEAARNMRPDLIWVDLWNKTGEE